MVLSDDAPLEVLNQNSKDLFYEPMFRDVVKRYLKLRKGDEQEELEEFVNDATMAGRGLQAFSAKVHGAIDRLGALFCTTFPEN